MKNNTFESPIRSILNKMTAENISHVVKDGMRVLEIGCGFKGEIKKRVEENGGVWSGVDPNRYTIASHVASVSSLPFEDGYFDCVIASQSIEHWYEFGTVFKEGLSEIWRVLKDDSILLIDYPYCLHGHPLFMLDMKNKVHRLFDKEMWQILEKKRYDTAKPYYALNCRKPLEQWLMVPLLNHMKKSAYIEGLTLKKVPKKGAGKYKKNIYDWVKKGLFLLLYRVNKRLRKVFKNI